MSPRAITQQKYSRRGICKPWLIGTNGTFASVLLNQVKFSWHLPNLRAFDLLWSA